MQNLMALNDTFWRDIACCNHKEPAVTRDSIHLWSVRLVLITTNIWWARCFEIEIDDSINLTVLCKRSNKLDWYKFKCVRGTWLQFCCCWRTFICTFSVERLRISSKWSVIIKCSEMIRHAGFLRFGSGLSYEFTRYYLQQTTVVLLAILLFRFIVSTMQWRMR